MNIKDRLIGNKVVVQCKNREEANGFTKWCKKNEMKWRSGVDVDPSDNNWWVYDEETCYEINNGKLRYANRRYYKDLNFKILQYSELFTPLKVSVLKVNGTNRDIVDRCRTTAGKDVGEKEPTPEFMRKLYMSEHSPIRVKHFIIRLENLPSWVATHFVRHKIGVEHFVRTQRDDRADNSVPRAEIPQGALVTMDMELNPQAVVSISRKRLCNQASKETREAWIAVIEAIKGYDEPLWSACVRECVYRGFCPEMKPCTFSDSLDYIKLREEYMERK